MPQYVSDLSTALSKYVHPKLTFLDVLNEVLPQLASKGIWKDLTFERSLTELASTDRFFTLPEDADSVLHALVNNHPTPVKPLWNAFVNEGASTGRMGHWYGVEDAGYVATKSILSTSELYALYIMPDFRWGEIDSDQTTIYNDTAFAGTETVTIVYENWEGIIRTSVTTLAATTTAQLLGPRGVRNIRSIAYTGFTTSPGLIVAVPIPHMGVMVQDGPDVSGVTALPGQRSAYGVEYFVEGDDILVYSMGSTAQLDEDTFITTEVNSTDEMYGTTDVGSEPTTPVPVMFFPTDVAARVTLKTGVASSAQKIAIVQGTGISRYRLFRQQDCGNNVHLLLRRKIPTFTDNSDIVYLDNLSALKYAILANTAEYNNDPVQARVWWAEAEKELNAELDKTIGAATPQVIFDPSGGQGSVGSMQ